MVYFTKFAHLDLVNHNCMPNILLLETATEVCSAALSINNEVIAVREHTGGNSHSRLLTVFIGELLSEASLTPQLLDAVCVSKGPGSYTGLRIGVSVAKGLCYALEIPLLAVNTLQAQASFVSGSPSSLGITIDDNTLLCPMTDARRMEVYTALFDKDAKPLSEIEAKIIDSNSFEEELRENRMLFFGNGADKCKSAITHGNAQFIEGFHASARFMSDLANSNYAEKKFEDVAYFEPFYLKDFLATTPKNKIL